MREPPQTKSHRQLARQATVRRRRNRVDARFVHWANVPVFVLLFSECETAAAGSEFYTESAAFRQREIVRKDASVFECFTRGRERERHGSRHVFAIFWIELRLPIEGRNFSSDLNWKTRRIEGFDSANAAATRNQSIPKRFASDAERRDTPHSRNDNPAWTCQPSEH